MSPLKVGQALPPAWRRASFCASGECVEVAQQDGVIILRDSTQPHGSLLYAAVSDFGSLVRNIKSGRFDGLKS